MTRCFACQKELTADETALYRRLVNRSAKEFLCYACLAAKFNVSEAELRRKVEDFKKSGCTLFS
ncbi:MAG TPA: hypothetical protein PK629_00080 [Oscillospiraceae bacterium]|nr:hypothetical protein [Oscillospiraceae bacterium]HPK35501.1 hypothetical protein [Oscillospiraceae bacterium]HPR76039.1 hypothetical protein [Oscillospiraceae bacterium]